MKVHQQLKRQISSPTDFENSRPFLPDINSFSSLNCQRAWVEISLNNLVHNVKAIKTLLSPQTAFMAVVKADAYGHGARVVAQKVLEHGADWLAVATVNEGIELRQSGISAPILLLGAISSPEEVSKIAEWQLQPTIGDRLQAEAISEVLSELKITLPVHLKIDTGMSRLGTSWQQGTEFVRVVKQLPYLQVASIYSHLATADDLDQATMLLQQQRFNSCITQLKDQQITLPSLHLANSAATIINKSAHYDLVRVGLALYGLYPAEHLKSDIDLKPVLEVKARITQIKTLPPETGVSYGHKYISDRPITVAVVSIGYADGVVRNLSNKLQVIVRGQLVRQIGAITMDQLMIDVSELSDLQAGEIVTLIGQDGKQTISADDWATNLGTISWEILCGFKHRLPRVIK